MNKREIKKIARQIFELEKNIELGKDVKENMDKIEEIVSHLSFGELIQLDVYITEKFLTN